MHELYVVPQHVSRLEMQIAQRTRGHHAANKLLLSGGLYTWVPMKLAEEEATRLQAACDTADHIHAAGTCGDAGVHCSRQPDHIIRSSRYSLSLIHISE